MFEVFNLNKLQKDWSRFLMNQIGMRGFNKILVMKIVHKTTQNWAIQQILLEVYEEPRIYQINCKNCDVKYIEHTHRPVLTREHGALEKS